MAAIEQKELTQSYTAGVAGNGLQKRTQLSLVKAGTGKSAAGNGHAHAAARALPPSQDEVADVETFKVEARGLAVWWRTLQIARVLGTMSLYLFLNDYDIRAAFNRRAAERKLEDARARGRSDYFKARARDLLLLRALDKLIRLVRFVVYRGAEASVPRERQLERQGAWLKENLIALGPTFIKIGQALGTRADLLPLAYVRELSTLQDKVPPFPTSEAFARIESELGRKLSEAYAEIDAEPVASASLGQVYRARLHTGQEVAVKVQRPHLREAVG